ncbi:DoxX family protein [Devosia sp.]|uniref:DoxX family protein n=1 Tax=Devosia sp. TaxID=1871048 RepID=UPI003265787B
MTDKRMYWAGWVLSGIAILFLVMDGGMKLVPLQVVLDTMTELGWSGDPALARGLGVIMLIATALYAWPKTSLLGAILLTGYLGGAMATHLRIGSPLFSHILFGFYLGLLVWGGLFLRDPALRAMMPFRR